jgi:hypothetical protein
MGGGRRVFAAYIRPPPPRTARMVQITSLQSIRIFGWRNPRPILVWDDVLEHGLTLDSLVSVGLRPSELVLVQPDPAQWVAHAGARLSHVRLMIHWPANPFAHLGADLADVLALRLSAAELLRMEVSYRQLVRAGMTEQTERMFRFGEEEWAMLGKPQLASSS